MALTNDQGKVIYIGGIENNMANGSGKIKKKNGQWIEGEWSDNVLVIDEDSFYFIEDGCVYLNETQRNSCFSCIKKDVWKVVKDITVISTDNK